MTSDFFRAAPDISSKVRKTYKPQENEESWPAASNQSAIFRENAFLGWWIFIRL
jgi:hypothetical protein